MSRPNPDAQSSTSAIAQHSGATLPTSFDEEDLALGWECANPALQIESWGADLSSQPLQKFN